MRLLDKMLSGHVRRGELTIIDHKGRERRYGAPDPELRPVTVRLADRMTPLRIARDPAVGTAEAYMDGRLVLEQGEILDLVLIIRRNRRWEDRSAPGKFLRKGSRLARPVAHLNWKRQARRNVAHHYDIGNDFYRLWMEADMQYSCGYFTDPGNSLEQAQLDKKAHLACKLHLKPGQRVLDIGCGWGGLALYLNRVADVDVLGVTLSTEQVKLARERAEAAGVADRVRFEHMDYRDVTGTFDRIGALVVRAGHAPVLVDLCSRQLVDSVVSERDARRISFADASRQLFDALWKPLEDPLDDARGVPGPQGGQIGWPGQVDVPRREEVDGDPGRDRRHVRREAVSTGDLEGDDVDGCDPALQDEPRHVVVRCRQPVHDPALASELEMIFERDTEHCVELTSESWSRRSLGHRLLDGADVRLPAAAEHGVRDESGGGVLGGWEFRV